MEKKTILDNFNEWLSDVGIGEILKNLEKNALDNSSPFSLKASELLINAFDKAIKNQLEHLKITNWWDFKKISDEVWDEKLFFTMEKPRLVEAEPELDRSYLEM